MILAVILFVCRGITAVADDTRGFTYSLDQSTQIQVLPPWITARPSASPSEHATVSFPITPPLDQSDLAVTFYFTESPGGFLRVFWAGARNSEMLSDNLFEGIGMPNQRTLLISRSTLSSPGTLTLQCSENTLSVTRVHFEWVAPAPVSLADNARQSILVDAVGRVFKDEDVNGAPLLPATDQIGKSIVTAMLSYKPERIEMGTEFVAPLQAVPRYARLEVEVSGAPLDTPLQLFLNGNPVGDVSVNVPDFNDPGYQFGNGSSAPIYIGWRKGVIFIPVGQLKIGDNGFQLGVKGAAPSQAVSPLAVKNLLLQLNYDRQTTGALQEAPAQGAAPAPAASSQFRFTVPLPQPDSGSTSSAPVSVDGSR